MQMIESIIQAVGYEVKLETDEVAAMQQLLTEALVGVRQMSLKMPEERWLALGIHLVSVLRRVENKEILPPVDQVMLDQVDADMQELSRRVLQAAEGTQERQNDATEVLLLAIHFAAAKHI